VEKKTPQVSTSDIFFEQQLADAMKAVKAKENFSVYSCEKGGKTNFLSALQERILQTKQYMPFLLNTRKTSTIKEFVKKNTLALIEEHKLLGGKNIYALSLVEADKLIAASDLRDETKSCIRNLVMYDHDSSAKTSDALDAFFTLISSLAKEHKSIAVLLLDDLEALEALKDERSTSEEVIKRLESPDESVVVIATRRRREGKRIDLGQVSIDEARRFTHALVLDEAALSALHNLTAGNVLYLSIFTKALQRGGARNADGINALAEEMLSNELGLYFSEKMKQLSPKENLILNCMAEHDVNTPARISKILDYPQTAVRRFLAIMEEKGFVELKERGVFEIHDQLFKKWLTIER
jgi:uncharacterized membrane protein